MSFIREKTVHHFYDMLFICKKSVHHFTKCHSSVKNLSIIFTICPSSVKNPSITFAICHSSVKNTSIHFNPYSSSSRWSRRSGWGFLPETRWNVHFQDQEQPRPNRGVQVRHEAVRKTFEYCGWACELLLWWRQAGPVGGGRPLWICSGQRRSQAISFLTPIGRTTSSCFFICFVKGNGRYSCHDFCKSPCKSWLEKRAIWSLFQFCARQVKYSPGRPQVLRQYRARSATLLVWLHSRDLGRTRHEGPMMAEVKNELGTCVVKLL